jgi:RNA polymerase sigma-70 factor (ECF subfamily)
MRTPLTDSGTTTDLLSAVAKGDERALNRLLARHRNYLKRVVDARLEPRLRGRIDPSDVVQETLVVASGRIEDFLSRRPTSFRIWLRRKALDQLIDQRRFHRRRKRDVTNEELLSDASSLAIARGLAVGSVSRSTMRRELVAQVRAAMEQLSETDREVLLLRHAEGLSNAEVAEVMELEPKAASARYGRAVLRLSAELRKQGIRQD